jgi:hypothetical protein
MDESFDLYDVDTEKLVRNKLMSGALQNDDDEMTIDQQHGGKSQIKCNNCGRTGHKANKCRSSNSNQNNNNNGQGQNGKKNGGRNNQNNGGNNNAPQNQNGRGKKGNNKNGGWVDPASTNPGDLCYMHGGHRNNECTAQGNVWSPKNNTNGNGNNNKKTKNGNNNQNQNQSQNQQQQNRPQHENRHGNQRTNSEPISGEKYNYCEFCNVVGHTLRLCNAPKHVARHILTCLQCKHRGHTYTECRHPAYCADCKSLGHSRDECRTPKPARIWITASSSGPPDWVLPTSDAPSMFAEQGRTASPPQQYIPVSQSYSHVYPPVYPQTIPQAQAGITKAFFANARGELVLEAPMDEVTSQICSIAAENEAARRQAIATKCCSAHMMYSLKLLNDEIISGASFFRRVDPSNPQIQLPPNVQKTEALERLCQFWINDNSFSMAAAFVRKGWNFFRDPRTLDAIARASTPVCHCCFGKGRILSATFTQLVPGTDVLTVEDYDIWGPSVMFSCQCSLNGYSFLQGEDSMEVCWS